MIFACDRCGRRYSVPDERVQGRAFRVTCKACGNVIQVRPGASAAPAAPAADPAPAVKAPAAPTMPAIPPAAVPAPRAPAPRAAPAVASAPAAVQPRAAAAVAPPPPPFAATAVAPPPAPPAARGDDPFAPFEPEPPPPAPATPPPPSFAAFEPEPPPPPPPTSERGLTAAEMAWMSDDERRAAGSAPTDELAGPRADPPEEPDARPRDRGPGLLRVLLAAGILGVAAAGAVALFWPSLRPEREPARPRTVATKPAKPAPPPAPPPVDPPPVDPPPAAVDPAPPPAASADAPENLAEPAKLPEPSRPASSRARFEPGTVTVARARKKEAHLSKKDRKLLDLLNRKKDSAAPPEKVEALDLDTGRSLDPAAVERVVAESQGAFSGCISRNGRPGQLARATLLLTVDATGAVASAWVAETEVSKSGLGRCLATAGRRLVFPAFEGAAVDVSVPLVLEAHE